jgi:hypothetical protein
LVRISIGMDRTTSLSMIIVAAAIFLSAAAKLVRFYCELCARWFKKVRSVAFVNDRCSTCGKDRLSWRPHSLPPHSQAPE